MRSRPARTRPGYRPTLTSSQRRHRWLLYIGLALLTLAGNRCSAWWARSHPKPAPAPLGKLV